MPNTLFSLHNRPATTTETLPAANGQGLVLDPTYLGLLAETIRGVASRDYAAAQTFESEQSGKAFCLPAATIGVKALLSGKTPDFSKASR